MMYYIYTFTLLAPVPKKKRKCDTILMVKLKYNWLKYNCNWQNVPFPRNLKKKKNTMLNFQDLYFPPQKCVKNT